MKYKPTKRFVIIYREYVKDSYFQKIPAKSDTFFETDDEDEFNEMLSLVKEDSVSIVAIDMNNNKPNVLYNTVIRNTKWDNTGDWQVLELYLGDGKTSDDFLDKDKYNQILHQSTEAPYTKFTEWQYRYKASELFNKYLKSKWYFGKTKKKKQLPKLQIFDDPHMVHEEIEALKKEEKEKRDLLIDRW